MDPKGNEDDRPLHKVGSAAFARAVVERAISPFVVIDSEWRLLYASDSLTRLIGVLPEDWLGRSVADLLAPESIEVAAAGLSEVFASTGNPDWVGGPVRLFLRATDGSSVAVDAETSFPEHTGVDGIVVQLHRAGGAQAMSDAIDAILEGANPTLALTRLTSLIEHDIAETRAVLARGWDGVGFAQLAGHDGAIDLRAPTAADRNAIHRGLLSGEDAIDLFPDLDPATQAAAEAAGKLACWLAPIPPSDGGPPDAALFVWHSLRGAPGTLYRGDLQRAVRLGELALRWEAQQHQLAWTSTHDALTRLTNREELQNRLDEHRHSPRAVLYCDLDDFKPVNDHFGHRAGDQVLVEVANRLRSAVGGNLAARLGGDEFAVLVEPLANPSVATTVANRVLDALRLPFDALGHTAVVGVSIGVAIDPHGTASGDLLLDEADRVLREGKAQGKNQVRVVEVR